MKQEHVFLNKKRQSTTNNEHFEIEANLKQIRTDKEAHNFEVKIENQQQRKLINPKIEINNSLPIYKYREEILTNIRDNQVTVIAGETGCGKTTQVPQYIYKDFLENNANKNKKLNILITQPRRIAAVSIAKRLSQEMNVRLGELVGFHVGMNPNFSKEYTKILIVTTGIFLQRIIHEKHLDEFTHIILDEVHERDVDIDFVLIMVKHILKRNKSIKLILMSATICTALFANFFSPKNIEAIDDVDFYKENTGFNGDVTVSLISDTVNDSGYWNSEDPNKIEKVKDENIISKEEIVDSNYEAESVKFHNEVVLEEDAAPVVKIEDKIYPVNKFYIETIIGHLKSFMKCNYTSQFSFDKRSPKIEDMIYDVCFNLIGAIHQKIVLPTEKQLYSVLIFLPGLGEIMTMDGMLKDKLSDQILEQLQILHLHSNLSE